MLRSTSIRASIRPAFYLFVLAAVMLSGCRMPAPIPFVSPSSTPEPSPTFTPTATATATATPTPTPTPPPARRVISGEQALFEGDWDTALAEFESAYQNTSDAEVQAAALLGKGRASYLAGDAEGALITLQDLVASYPESPHIPHAHFFMAQAYQALEQYLDAADHYLLYLAMKPGVIDTYVLNWRGDALFAAGDYGGAALDFAGAYQAPGLTDNTLLRLKLARSLALSGDTTTALSLYDEVYAGSSDDNTRALIALRKGQIYDQLGQPDQTILAYQDAVNNYPTSYNAYTALVALVDGGVPVNELNRGLVDYFAGQYQAAQAAFERYLSSSPADPATGLYYQGLNYRAQGEHVLAVQVWEQLIAAYPEHRFWDDSWEQKAYTQWNFLGNYDGAVNTLLAFVQAAPQHPRAAEFLFDAGLVSEIAGKLETAVQVWDRLPVEYPGFDSLLRAAFLSGITRYRLGDYSGAIASFQRCLGLAGSLDERAMALFWTGKAQNALGEIDAARATWELAASVSPTDYYSERARDLLLNRVPFTPPQEYDLVSDPARAQAQAEEWLRSTFNLPPETDLSGLGPLANDPYLLRGSELWQLGMYAEARIEFEALRHSVDHDPALSYRLARYLTDLGLYRSAIQAARQVLNLAGMDDAGTLSAPAYFNHIRFGAFFQDLIIPSALEYELHPLVLFSLIRQESLFEGFAESPAAASGLMQIIPSTGAEIAGVLGWPPNYTSSDLTRPMVSVRFGTYYLAAQRDAFEGDLYAALAAYNGGPGNAAAWKRLAPQDPDLFLEIVRFQETRNYIRGVSEIFNLYRTIYNRTP